MLACRLPQKKMIHEVKGELEVETRNARPCPLALNQRMVAGLGQTITITTLERHSLKYNSLGRCRCTGGQGRKRLEDHR
jgi:hypothetical protein